MWVRRSLGLSTQMVPRCPDGAILLSTGVRCICMAGGLFSFCPDVGDTVETSGPKITKADTHTEKRSTGQLQTDRGGCCELPRVRPGPLNLAQREGRQA